MARFASPTHNVDHWTSTNYRREDGDRVVLPPISAATGTSSSHESINRRSSIGGAPHSTPFAFSNTFETARPSSSRMDVDPSASQNASAPPSTFGGPRRPALGGMRAHTTSSVPTINDINGAFRSSPSTSLPSEHSSGMPNGNDPMNMAWLNPSSPTTRSGPNGTNRSPPYVAYPNGSEFDSFNAGGQGNGLPPPQSPAFSFGPAPYPQHGNHPMYVHPRTIPSTNPPASLDPAAGSNPNASREELENELKMLRTKVRELEFINDLVQLRVVELENEKAAKPKSSSNSPPPFSTSSSGTAMPPPSPSFQASWKARTDARIKRFCSLNRAGNALCAWHDSRRERRSFPPRMAPPGYLNCGCTFEEALFEESLARHGVGSYHPGEMVRMDPALRNPLLKLLSWRFGYRDGDFERDPVTGDWVEGEGPAVWESAKSGVGPKKRGSEEAR